MGGGVGAGKEWEDAEGWRRKRSRMLSGRFGMVRGVGVLDEEEEEEQEGQEKENGRRMSGGVGGLEEEEDE